MSLNLVKKILIQLITATGSGDLLYVQATSTIKAGSAFMQVKFTPQTGTSYKYAYLKDNSSYHDSANSAANGYVCVIPADKQYSSYRVEKWERFNTNIQNYTDDISLDYVAATATEHAYNKVTTVSSSVSSSDEVTVYFTDVNNWGQVYAHVWGGSGYDSVDFPDRKMTYSYTNAQNQKVYVCRLPAGAQHLKFNSGSNANETLQIDGLVNNKGWYVSGGSGGNCTVGEWWPFGQGGSTSTAPANLCKLENFVNGTKVFVYGLHPVDWPCRAHLPRFE